MAAQEPTAPEIFEPLVKAGEVELQRGPKDLALSGFIAGLDIGFGPLAMAVVAGRLHEAFHLAMAQTLFFGSFLYPLGFVVVVMGQSELFTENTLTPVAGLLAGEGSVGKLAKRWAIVLACNTVGTVVFSLVAAHTSIVFAPYGPIYRAMGMPLVSHSFLQATLAAVFGGWLVALMAWLIEATRGSLTHLIIIYMLTYLLVGLDLYHCVIGSIDVLLAMFAGAPITWARWLTAFLAPAVVGNAIGGVIFVTGLKAFQARSRV
jgi:formate/nitrite transporter FocA (FNT family)